MEVSRKILVADKSSGIECGLNGSGKGQEKQRQQTGRWSTYRGPVSAPAEFIHSTNISLCTFSVPQRRPHGTNQKWRLPYGPSLVLTFSKMYLLESKGSLVRNFLTIFKTI